MSASLLRRPRRAIAGLAAALVSAGVLVAGVAAPATAGPDAAQSASEKAQDTGEPVPIPELTDSFTTVTAQPDGTFQKDVSNVPERIHRNDTWVNVDATLRPNSDGSLSPAASYTPLTLSGGGDGPLAVLHHDQQSLSLTWPTSLPAPTISGDTAIYADVLPGVDLRVTADNLGGMSDVLVVKTAEAAANPALTTLTLAAQTSSGLTVQSDTGNNVTVLDTDGQALFHSPAPMMWDSSTAAAASAATADGDTVDETDPADGPGPGAQVKPVGVQADDDSVTLTPDAGLLTGSTTQYPVYIDPAWTDGQTYYAWVQEAFPNSSNWNTTDNGEPAVGYCGWDDCIPHGRTRSFFQFHPGSLTNTHVISAYFKVTGVSPYAGSANCDDAHPMVVNSTDLIDHTIHWGNEPSIWSQQDTANAYNGYGSCPNRTATFNVTSSAQADNGQGTLTYRIRASSETNRNDYMRFNHKASLTLNYNKVPNIPTSFKFSPTPTPNHTGFSDAGWIGAAGDISLAAHISDPDGSAQSITGQFHVWDKGGSGTADATDVIAWTDSAGHSSHVTGSGGTVSIKLPTSKLIDGHKYGADARTVDAYDTSGVTDYQYFWYDATAPKDLAVSSSDFPAEGTATHKIGEQGVVHLAATDHNPTDGKASGLDHFTYSLASAADLADGGGTLATATVDTATGIGSADATIKPTVWGVNYLYVAAVDKAGNQSATATYTFYVLDDPTAAVSPGDVDGRLDDGATRPDLLAANKVTTNLELYQTLNRAPDPIVTASDGSDSPDGTSWANTLIAHRLSSTGTRVDDLWAHKPGTSQLFLYKNNLNNAGGLDPDHPRYYTRSNWSAVPRPLDCADTDCSSYTTTDWSHVTQLIAPGDMTGDGKPDLLTVEDGTLWLFPSSTVSNQFLPPHSLGTGYASMRLVAPGDASGDGLPDLWGFDDNHTINMYLNVGDPNVVTTITLQPSTDTDPYFDSDQRPLISSPGDADGDGNPDVYTTVNVAPSISSHQQLWANMGQSIGNHAPDLAGHTTVDDTIPWENITNLA
ncbi:hypothetical protein NUM_42160 [Actinocatenispora comari]|jgi:hypothetical protein|uniref:VCBS repeat-containing protein n=2 Tax=Actinocatenispora comari TaxID=2807577 RepID=A0A8J4AFY7_9ACTN|nr:hypothetical protein NUM_42160 [Actinocatenispora comari]